MAYISTIFYMFVVVLWPKNPARKTRRPDSPGTRMPPELVKRLGPTGPPAPPSGPSGPGGPVDPRMHWLEPWRGLDGNKYDKEDLQLGIWRLFGLMFFVFFFSERFLVHLNLSIPDFWRCIQKLTGLMGSKTWQNCRDLRLDFFQQPWF